MNVGPKEYSFRSREITDDENLRGSRFLMLEILRKHVGLDCLVDTQRFWNTYLSW